MSVRRLAAIYDIHGNLPALEGVLEDIRAAGVDHVVVGGDVLPGPMAHEALALLAALNIPTTCIMGNGDREVLEYRKGMGSNTIPEQFREMMRWVARSLQELGNVLFFHATPRSDTEMFSSQTAETTLLPIFAGIDEPIVV